MTTQELLKDVEEKMEKAVAVFTNEVKGIRTGRATPGLVENIRVEYYGSPTPLKQIASISVPEPRLLVIKPFDATSLKNIEKAILKSELTPNSDGRLIRVQVPPLSQERRQQLANQVKDMGEKAKVAIRNIRRDGNKQAEDMEEASEISEDDSFKVKEKIQDFTKNYEKKVDEIYEEKKKEITQV